MNSSNPKDRLELIMEIRSKILDHSGIKDVAVAEQIARQWVSNLHR